MWACGSRLPARTDTMFGRWFGADGVPWCAIFASYCFDVGAGVVLCRGWHGAGVEPARRRLRADARRVAAGDRPRRREHPQPGDLVVFDWDGGAPDHVGIVIRALRRRALRNGRGQHGGSGPTPTVAR